MKYVLIINPKSGQKNHKLILKELRKHFLGKDLVIKVTTKQGDAITYAKKAKADVVIAAGGDGTVNEVINGLMQKSINSRPRLGIIPAGTSNMVARSLSIPKNLAKAVEIISNNRRKDLDIGKVNKRFFAIGCGVGLDAEMYKNVEPKIKKIFGEVAYPLSFIKTVFNYKPHRLKIRINHESHYGYYVLICNITKFHKLFDMIPKSRNDDGYFDVIIIKKKEIGDLFRCMFGVATKQMHKFKDLVHVRAKKIKVSSSEKVIAHADAEIIGKTPVSVKMYERALEVIC